MPKTVAKKRMSPSQKEDDVFEKEYARLNVMQKKAVDLLDGPVMVIAGPGTGKTQVLAMRVANILKKTHMRPGNILCVTYSVSGATAMRDRLRSIIGADAYGVEVTTIHGFCNDIIRRYPEVFHEFSSLSQVSDVRRFQIVNAIIDELPPKSVIVNPKDRYGRTKDILARISELKREAVSEQTMEEAARTYSEEMQGKSREGTKAHARNVRLARQFEEFLEIFRRYEETLRDERLYDYEDMIGFVITALAEEEWLRANLQERYQYVLVDEFQDTNGAQNKVIELLTTFPSGMDQSPNLFVVGDDDQAIYRFQGASVENMLSFRKRHPECGVLTLTENYRSTQSILDAAGTLIAHNTKRAITSFGRSGDERLRAAAGGEGHPPVLQRPVSDAVEAFAVGERIADMLADGTDPGEIAVFTRTNAELFPLHDALLAMDIPVQLVGKLDVLSDSCVRQFFTLLRAAHDPKNSVLLAQALACPCFSCHPADIARLSSLLRTHEADGPKPRLYDLLSILETRAAEWDIRTVLPLCHARDLLFDVHENMRTLTLPALCEKLLRDSGLLPEDADGVDPLHFTAIQEFYAYLKARAYESSSFGLPELLQDIDYRETYGLALQYAVPHLTDRGVQLMTAHGSKGLEFDTVFVVNFREKHWDHKRKNHGLSIPSHLLFPVSDEEGADLDDERRLAYVAWTRARKNLVLACPERVTRGEREQGVSPSQFFPEGGEHLREERYELRDPSRANTLILPKPAADLDDHLRTYIRRKLETFELSVTALNVFLEDPLLFLREELLAMPRAKSPAQSYGTAVHAALREWALAAKAGSPLSKEALLRAFESALTEREILVPADRDMLLVTGRDALSRYYDARLTDIPVIHAVERKLTGRLGDVPLKGFLDRIDLFRPDGAKTSIIDYKTGAPKTEKQVREEYAGNLYRQLVFYKILSEVSPQFAGYEAEEFRLDFVGERDAEPRLLTFTVTPEEVRELSGVIVKVWDKITRLDFTPIDT